MYCLTLSKSRPPTLLTEHLPQLRFFSEVTCSNNEEYSKSLRNDAGVHGSTAQTPLIKRRKEPNEKRRKLLPRILLTGSSGMLGTRLFERLLDLGFEICGIDRKRNRWNHALQGRTHRGDLLRKSSLNMPDEFDMVVHFAANARVYELVKNPELAFENISTTFNVLEFARRRDISKLLFASSREVYGNLPDRGPISEDKASLRNCESPYAASKIAGETMLESYNKVYGLAYVIIRYSNVYGMYDDSDRVIPLWIRRALKDQQLVVYGRHKSLDFTYIDDAVDGTIEAIKRFERSKNNVFNIASGLSLIHI